VQPPDNSSTGEQLLTIMDDENGSAREWMQAPPTPVLIYIYGQVRLPCPSRELLTGIMNATDILAY